MEVDPTAAPLPLTQWEIADALGLSAVHVTRTLQQLHKEGSITLDGGRVTIDDYQGLRAASQFDPKYLRLRSHAAGYGGRASARSTGAPDVTGFGPGSGLLH